MSNGNVLAKCFAPMLCVPLLLTISATAQEGPTVFLAGHVLGILPNATPLPRDPQKGQEPLTICVLLNVSDQEGFDAFGRDFSDPSSHNYGKTITAAEFTASFGPTQQAYDTVLAYLKENGFSFEAPTASRRTITAHGTRAQAEAAFHVNIDDYVLGSRTFHAIANDPALPAEIAPLVAGISGLSNLAQWRPALAPTVDSVMTAYHGALTPAGSTNKGGLPPGLDGTGQTIALIEFYAYDKTLVANSLAREGLPADLIVHVTPVYVNSSRPTNDNTEVTLDVVAALGAAPGANILVYIADFSGTSAEDHAATFFTVIDNAIPTIPPGSAISMSYGLCEPQITSSDATNMETLLKGAAFVGITMFAATGDTAGACADSSSTTGTTYPGAISFPADTPHAVAVGGTQFHVGKGNTYKSENWWNDSKGNGGGFGLSTFFSSLSGSGKRSVPDVAMDAWPGIEICPGTSGATIICGTYAGTSLAAPLWASTWALVNQANADAGVPPRTASNGYLFTIPDAFHSPSTMTGPGNDSAHLGLGTPDVTKLVSDAGPPVQVTSISPGSGPAAGGTTVTIHGKGFIGVHEVDFSGIPATNVTIYSDSKLTADSPAAAGKVDIQVLVWAGESPASSADVFSYELTINKISPSSGSLDGGPVTVSGEGLSDKLKFDFGGKPATSVACASASETTCTMVAPAHAAGTVDVVVETGSGHTKPTPGDQFQYVAPAITGVSPQLGLPQAASL